MENEIFEFGQYYHIYNRGNNKENIFIESRNYNYFLLKMKEYLIPIADIYAYCLLKNHFHIVLRIKDKDELSEKFQNKIHLPFSNFFNSYSKSINKGYNRTGSLFQEHLQRNRITEENYLKQLIVYVHLNPLKHKFSKTFENYSYSSYQSYLSNKETSLDRDFILDLFGGIENFKFYHQEKSIKYEGVLKEIDDLDYD